MQPSASFSHYADVRRLVLFILGVLLAGALLSVPLYWGAQALMRAAQVTPENATTWPMSEIAKASFDRFFNRAVLISALAGLPLMIRASRRRAGETGPALLPPLRPRGPDLRLAITGFLLAGGLLLLLGWIYLRTGVYQMNAKPGWSALGQPLTAAFGAGIVEEILFRGFILGLLLRSLRPLPALLWTTFIYDIVHFLKPPEGFELPASEVTWHSGFDVIAAIGGHFGDLNFILAEFFTLFAVGWVVGRARLRTGSLWPGIGLHAGWVFGLKYYSVLTHSSKALRHGDWLPWIGEGLKEGLVPFVVVLFTGWIASLTWPCDRSDATAPSA